MSVGTRKAMILRYVAIVLKEPDTSYFATVPDLGVCFGIGDTPAEAKASLADALTLHIDGVRSDGTPMPSPRSRDEVLSSIDDHIMEAYVVEVDIELSARPLRHPSVPGIPRLS